MIVTVVFTIILNTTATIISFVQNKNATNENGRYLTSKASKCKPYPGHERFGQIRMTGRNITGLVIHITEGMEN